MGLIGRLLKGLFGNGRNVVVETAEVFRENAEAGAQRLADYDQAALAQFATEFQHARKGRFDRFMDGLNRLPRPLTVLALFWLFALAAIDPIWFAEIMTALTLVPEPLWWCMGTVVTFYFGGRMQEKLLQSRHSLKGVAEQLPQTLTQIAEIRELDHDSPGVADSGSDAGLTLTATASASDNPALDAWRLKQLNTA